MKILFSIEKFFQIFLSSLLFLLPWQTIWIVEEKFLNGAKWEWGTIGWYGTEILLWFCILLFIIWYIRKIINHKSATAAAGSRPRGGKIINFRLTSDHVLVFACLLFIIYSFLSAGWAIDREVSFQHALYILEAFLLFFMLFLGPLPWQKAALWFVVGAVVQSGLGIWQFLAQSTFASTLLGLSEHVVSEPGVSIISGQEIGRWLRAYGAFPHPNTLGGYLAVSIALTFFLWMRSEDRSVATREVIGDKVISDKKNVGIKLFLAGALLIQITALFFTFSRSAWLAGIFILIASSLLAYHGKHSRKSIPHHLSPVIAMCVFLAILFFPLVQTRFGIASVPHETASVSQRVSGYREAEILIRRSPWLGVGAGNYTAALAKQYPSRNGWEYEPAHNVVLLLLAELGIVGVLFLCLAGFAFVLLCRTCKINRTKRTYSISYLLSLIIPFVPLIPLLLFDHYLFSSYIGLLLLAVYFGLAGKYLCTAFPQE